MTLDNLSLPDKIRVLSKEFSPTDRHSLPDRIIRSLLTMLDLILLKI